MALRKCNECGGDLSTKATACPHCGAKIVPWSTQLIQGGCGLIMLAILIPFILLVLSSC